MRLFADDSSLFSCVKGVDLTWQGTSLAVSFFYLLKKKILLFSLGQ